MWHKLREIFGYKDSRHLHSKSINSDKNERIHEEDNNASTQAQVNIENSKRELNESNNNVQNTVQDDEISTWNQIKNKWNEDCFECKVTASVAATGLVLHVCNSLWKKRVQYPSSKVKYIYMTNVSLLGMWSLMMKSEWYDSPEQKEESRKNSLILTLLDKIKS